MSKDSRFDVGAFFARLESEGPRTPVEAQVAEHLKRQAARAATRARLDEARRHGLAQRQAQRLARVEAEERLQQRIDELLAAGWTPEQIAPRVDQWRRMVGLNEWRPRDDQDDREHDG